MKKFIALLLSLLLAFSLFGCGKKENDGGKNSKGSVSAVTSRKYEAVFASSGGEEAAKLDANIPAIDEETYGEAAATFNRYFDDYLSAVSSDLNLNADNIIKTLKNIGAGAPRITQITYEVYFESDSLVSVLISTKIGSHPEDATPEKKPMTFSLITGERMSLADFRIDETDANYIDEMLEGVLKQADKTYSPNGVLLSNEKKEILSGFYEPDEFLISEYGEYVFIFPLDYVSEGSRTGDYYCNVPTEYVEEYFINPLDY